MNLAVYARPSGVKTTPELTYTRVSCTQSYFVSELSWCPEGDLKGARDVELQVCTLGSPLEVEKGSQVTPSAGEHGEGSSSKIPCALSEEVKKKMDTCPYVLDIDLDFFSTRNPFYSIFNEKQFDILRKLYHYEHPKELTDEYNEILDEIIRKRSVKNEAGGLRRAGDSLGERQNRKIKSCHVTF
ncbi:hypothetical protein AVEN_179575-1 [Araneus ventricosus]|uniref:Uncharacterized protein n=1 Tax=Araneus ventricosus TaxID=182803 RepID=A0A4Y2BE40_ARAVE|nr:hypothetical protein AVEN_179575-1 [Araneus ventricosus]